jgi:hypothetical protein
MAEKTQEAVPAESASGDPHIDCWHWQRELTPDGKAEAVCCFDASHTVSVGIDNPFLRGEHGPNAG